MCRELASRGHETIGRTSAELDLRSTEQVEGFFAAERPEYVVLAAAKVGGIMANSTYPADFLSDNLRIQVNVIDAAQRAGVQRLLFLGSSCIYPKFAEQPIREAACLPARSSRPTNITRSQDRRHQACPGLSRATWPRLHLGDATNLYGPGDNFDLQSSHVLPALIRKAHEAKRSGGAVPLTIWGTGSRSANSCMWTIAPMPASS